jgi:hypothetical protein
MQPKAKFPLRPKAPEVIERDPLPDYSRRVLYAVACIVLAILLMQLIRRHLAISNSPPTIAATLSPQQPE